MNIEWHAPVRCIFTPRESLNGLKVRDNVMAHAGKEMLLRHAWSIDDDDSRYPGELALMNANDPATRAIFDDIGIAWVASGDVTPIKPE